MEKEYIDFLKSFNDKNIENIISLFERNKITFGELESITLDNGYISSRSYMNTFKIGKIISNIKKGTK